MQLWTLNWCGNSLICQPFNLHLTYYHPFTCKSFRSGKCGECMVCYNSIKNYTSSCFIFYAINISLTACNLLTGLFAILIKWISISMGWLYNITSRPKSYIGCWLIKMRKHPSVFILIGIEIVNLVRNTIAYLSLSQAEV